jgi:hypothetical protein
MRAGCSIGRVCAAQFSHIRRVVWTGEDGVFRSCKDVKKVLNNPALARKTAKFIVATRLLRQFWGYSQRTSNTLSH